MATNRPTVTITIHVHLDSQLISGEAQVEDGISHLFAGWLELAALLDEVRAAARADSGGARRLGYP